MVKLLSTTQIPLLPPPPFNSHAQTFVTVILVSSESVLTPLYTMPEGRSWGMPSIFDEVSHPYVSETPRSTTQYAGFVPHLGATRPQATVTFSAPFVRTAQQDNKPIFHSGSVGAYDRVDDLQEKFDEMQREVKALRGKELFEKDAYDLQLVYFVVVWS